MSRTASTSIEGDYCGRAAQGVSKLSWENLREIEAERLKPRPTPWAHLALRYAVNEIDLRTRFESPAAEGLPKRANAPKPLSPGEQKDQRFRSLWLACVSKKEISEVLGISFSSIDTMRLRLGLAPRSVGYRTNDWRSDEDDFIRRHYVIGGETAASVAKKLGRTRHAVIGRAHRMGWTRHTLRDLAA